MVDSPDDKASGTQGPHQWPGSRCFDTTQSPLDAVQVSRSGLRSGLRWFRTFGLPKPLPGLTYHHPYIGGVRDAMPRGIDRSPASTLLGLAPLALTAWIGKSWTRLPRGHGNGVVLVVLISFSFVWPGWRPLRRRKTSGRCLAQPRKGAEVIRLPAARIARILPTSGWNPLAVRFAETKQRHVLCLPHCDKNDGADEVEF